jgi:L-cysteine S-thiosulfotransferase
MTRGRRACAYLASATIMLSPLVVPAQHGTPKGWRFTWPKGDVAKGRAAFAKFECYACHEVKGETFPARREPGKVGPELSVMGPLHEVEYFAESVLNPGAVIERGKGYEAADGSSKMPSFNDSMTVQELIDLIAYLRALKPVGTQGHQRH